MESTTNNRIILIGRIHYGRVPMHELANMSINKDNDKLKCRRCGSTKDIMLNGYCIDCEEELSTKA